MISTLNLIHLILPRLSSALSSAWLIFEPVIQRRPSPIGEVPEFCHRLLGFLRRRGIGPQHDLQPLELGPDSRRNSSRSGTRAARWILRPPPSIRSLYRYRDPCGPGMGALTTEANSWQSPSGRRRNNSDGPTFCKRKFQFRIQRLSELLALGDFARESKSLPTGTPACSSRAPSGALCPML